MKQISYICRVETVKGIINRTKETYFKKCLGERCPYYRAWGIFCEKAIKGDK